MPRLHLVAALTLTALLATSTVVGQQGGTTIYVYDDNGRLIAVISPSGEASSYHYDAAGNFTAIRRFTANDLGLLAFTPRQGPFGTSVTIYGTGFNQGVSAVYFNGTLATITSSDFASVVALVPQGATSGPITVVTPRGTVVSTVSFVVRGISLTPQSITLPALEVIQFEVAVIGTPTNSVIWTVNGIEGGATNVGTITPGGFYAAPNLTGSNSSEFAVRATSVDDPDLFEEAIVTVVPFGAGSQFRTQGVSVRYGTALSRPPTYLAGAISVRYGTSSNAAATFIAGAVSVTYGTPANTSPTYIQGAVSVTYGIGANTTPVFTNGAVSASRGPAISSLNPGFMTRGTSSTLTIDGVAMSGATIKFFRLANGNPENAITISNLSSNSQGTSLTADVAVGSSVAIGRFIVVVTTSTGSTVRNDTGTNTVQIN